MRKPIEAPKSANPIPVLPAVPSTIVPPGFNSPDATAARMINKAARSLTDCPGFINSAFPRISHPVATLAADSLTKGVFPTAAAISECIVIILEPLFLRT